MRLQDGVLPPSPCARVQDISKRLHDMLKGEVEQPEVVAHVGTNDIGRKQKEVRSAKPLYGIGSKTEKQDLQGSDLRITSNTSC